MSDLKDQFAAYRAKAMAGNEGPFAAMGTGFAALKAFVAEDWPELALLLEDCVEPAGWRQIGHGHHDGSLEQLTYQVGTEALGHRTYDMTYDRDSRAWVPSRRP